MRDMTPYEAMLEAWRSHAEATMSLTAMSLRFWADAFRPAGDVTVNFPFGQGFTMNIAPATSWDFGRTAAPELERDILDRAGSYGLQLGRIMDLVALMAPQTGVGGKALDDFADLKTRIDTIKLEHGHAIVKAPD